MVDNTIALQVKPLDIATPLMQAAKMRQMESEQQRTQEADNRDAVASEMRGLAPYANSPDFAGRWTQSIDNLAAANKMRPDIAARMRDQPSVMAMHSVLAQSESPEMQFKKQEAERSQKNADRTFDEGVRQFNATPVTLGDNPVNGTIRGVRDPSSPSGFRPIDISGGGRGAYPAASQPSPAGAPGDEAAIPGNAQLVANESGRDIAYLKEIGQKYGPEVAATVKNLAEYNISPTSLSTKGGHREFYLGMASKFDPTYNAQKYPEQQATRISFSKGPHGDTVRSMNVGIDHLATLQEYADALKNGDIRVINAVKNKFKEQFGFDAPVNFNAVKSIVGAEVSKAIVGAKGALEDRKEIRDTLNAASSPDQLIGPIAAYKKLMGGQIKGLKKQYESAGLKGFDEKLFPTTLKELGVGGESASGAASGAGTVDYTSYFK